MLTVTLCMILSGCGESLPPTAPVKGKVTLNGQPLPNASVNFYPEEGKVANGVTDDAGNFTLSTFDPNDGAIIGKHKATVTIVNTAEIPEEIPDDYDYTASGSAEKSNTPNIPELYSDSKESPLAFEVKAGEENVFELKLE